jgi:hypothetical protein
VYDGPDDTYPVLATWWGNTLPPVIYTSSGVGAMCVKFKSDVSQTAGGWSANYQAYGNTPSCGGGIILSTPTGSFNDGSGSGNYGNNQECYWFISPPCASSVTLSFSQFNTELNYDGNICLQWLGQQSNTLSCLFRNIVAQFRNFQHRKKACDFCSVYSTQFKVLMLITLQQACIWFERQL